MEPSVDADNLARLAARADEWWDPAGAFAPLHALNPVRLDFIRQQALSRFGRDPAARAPFAGLKALDIGCGGGLVAEPMARLGFQVTAIDAAEEALAAARAHAGAFGLAIDYRRATAESLVREGAGPFDLVLALEVIEHVDGPEQFLVDAASLLAPGGLMVLSTLNRTLRSLALGKIAAEYLLRWAPVGAHDWRKFMTPEELTARLAGAGLEPGAMEGLAFDPLRGLWRRSSDAAVNYMIAAARA